MVKYNCIYCKKDYNHKGNFLTHHIKCKKLFELKINTYKSISIYNLLNEITELTIYKNNTKLNEDNNKNKYSCEKCGNNYLSYNGLKKHKLKCLNQININNKQNNISNINTNNGFVNNGTINITNNINLTPYDKIRYDQIEMDFAKELIEIPGEALPKLTHLIFFDPANKENHVILCPNLKDGQILVYTKNSLSPDGWEFVDKKDFFTKMIMNQITELENIRDFNEAEDNELGITSYVGFNKMTREMRTNENVKKEYIKKLNNVCYQNNSIVQQTKEEIEAKNKLRERIRNYKKQIKN